MDVGRVKKLLRGLFIGPAALLIAAGLPTTPAVAAVDESTGALDRTFSRDGIVRTDFSKRLPGQASHDLAAAAVVRADGRTIVAGQADSDIALARYRRNGELDTTFLEPVGLGTFDASPGGGGDDGAADLAIQPDGDIVVAGYVGSAEGGGDLAVARFDAEGALDPSFGVGGVARTPASQTGPATDDQALALAIQPDGKIVVAGSAGGADGDSVLARFTAGGNLDPSFSGDGLLRADVSPGGGDRFVDLVVGGSGAITAVGVAGRADDPGEPDLSVARFRPDGTPDGTLGGDGVVTLDLFGGADLASSIALGSDGELIVGATAGGPGFCDAVTIASITPAGTLDGSFGQGGLALADLAAGCGERLGAVVMQENGKALVGGGTGEGEFALLRLTARGTLDPRFGGDGIVVRRVDVGAGQGDGRESSIAGLAIGRAGSVVAVGSSRPDPLSTAWTVMRFSNPCALAAAGLRSAAIRFAALKRQARKARAPRARARLDRAAARAGARMRHRLAKTRSACR
jgi:uncharacterized delta-60 repeat protein